MKYFLLVAISLIIIGGLIFVIAAGSMDWQLDKLFNGYTEETVTDISESFNEIVINTTTADINILPCEMGECKVVVNEVRKVGYDTSIENGILKINRVDERKWYERIFSTGRNSLTLYIPSGEYESLVINESTGNIVIAETLTFGTVEITLSTGNTSFNASVSKSLSIKGSTGDVRIEGNNCGSIEVQLSTGNISMTNVCSTGDVKTESSTGNVTIQALSCNNLSSVTDTGRYTVDGLTVTGDISIVIDTGKTTLTDVTCNNVTINGGTGDINMTSLIATGKLTVNSDTGDVIFNGCDASEIDIETDTGDVRGSLLSEKIFFYKTDTGKVNLPESVTGGKCRIETDTGDINIEIK